MPVITRHLMDDASYAICGDVSYTYSGDRQKLEEFRKLIGMSKGQWKRFKFAVKKAAEKDGTPLMFIDVNKMVARKLQLIVLHEHNPHLRTLLKIAEAQEEAA